MSKIRLLVLSDNGLRFLLSGHTRIPTVSEGFETLLQEELSAQNVDFKVKEQSISDSEGRLFKVYFIDSLYEDFVRSVFLSDDAKRDVHWVDREDWFDVQWLLSDKPKCIYQMRSKEIDISRVINRVLNFIKDSSVFGKIVRFAKIRFPKRSRRRLYLLKIECLSDLVGKSSYNRGTNTIKFRFKTFVPHKMQLVLHIALHEMMHCICMSTCIKERNASDEERVAQAHCIEFKKGLLLADFLLGLITREQFDVLRPLIRTFEPDQPYAFEKSYTEMLSVTTRFSLNYSIKAKKISEERRPNFKTELYINQDLSDRILDLAKCPVYKSSFTGLADLFKVPTDIYVNDIVSNLQIDMIENLEQYLNRVILPNQLLAILDRDVIQYIYIDRFGVVSEISEVFAWWLLAL